jgi:hypothetical protein
VSYVSSTAQVTPITGESIEDHATASSTITITAEEARLLGEALSKIAPKSHAATTLAKTLDAAATEDDDVVLVMGVGSSDEFRERLRHQLDALVETMMPPVAVSEAAAVLAQRNAQRRAALLNEFGALSGEQIAEERSRARNRHALAARWRKEKRLFGVPHQGHTIYPAFQFDDAGQLRTVIGEVLERLPTEHMSAWEVALWWTAPNGWLHGRRPVDLMEGDPGALPPAAARLAEPSPL